MTGSGTARSRPSNDRHGSIRSANGPEQEGDRWQRAPTHSEKQGSTEAGAVFFTLARPGNRILSLNLAAGGHSIRRLGKRYRQQQGLPPPDAASGSQDLQHSGSEMW